MDKKTDPDNQYRDRIGGGGRLPYEPAPPPGKTFSNAEVTRRYRDRRNQEGFRQINALVDERIVEGLKALAEEKNLTMSQVIGMLLKRSLKIKEARIL